MEYNSNRKQLILPEYGRNIQNMVNHVTTIENREERQKAAQTIIDIMGNLFPYLRDVPDFKHKLWDHLAIMTDFSLDIDYPYELPEREMLLEKPNKIPYPTGRIRYRHYGKVIETMIKRATEYEPGPEKDNLIQMLADHMKKCYLTWNKETLDDNIIFKDLVELSKGKIEIPEGMQLKEARSLIPKKKKPVHNNNNGKRKNDYRRN